MLVVAFVTTVLVFAMLHLAPGNPAIILLGGRPATPAALHNITARYGLDKPLPVQYGVWLSKALRGDFGESVAARDTVAHVVWPRLGTTFFLTAYAMLIMLAVGIPLGMLSAVFRNGKTDVAATAGALTFASVPSYVVGLALIIIFGVELAWLPTFGGGESGGFAGRLSHLTLPAIALALASMAFISRVTRSAMIKELSSEHVEALRIQGFSERRIVLKHAVRGALIPVVTVSGVMFGYLLAGAILVEYVFAINGIGTLLIESVQGRDFAVVQAITLIVVAEFLILSLVVDLLYGVIDPRVRLSPESR